MDLNQEIYEESDNELANSKFQNLDDCIDKVLSAKN